MDQRGCGGILVMRAFVRWRSKYISNVISENNFMLSFSERITITYMTNGNLLQITLHIMYYSASYYGRNVISRYYISK